MTRVRLSLPLLLVSCAAFCWADEPAAATGPTPPAPATTAAPAAVSPLSATGLAKVAAAPAPAAEAKPVEKTDDDLLVLPKMKVTPKPRIRLSPQVVLSDKGLAAQKLSSFDRNFLNKYTLPLFGQSAAERLRDEQERSKNEQMRENVLSLANAAAVTDPAQAQTLRDAVNKP